MMWPTITFIDEDGNVSEGGLDEYDARIEYSVPDFRQRIDQHVAARDERLTTNYNDRLWQFDHKKYDRCCQEVWGNAGQYFYPRERSIAEIERFLALYHGVPSVTLLRKTVTIRPDNGFPVWCFVYLKNKE